MTPPRHAWKDELDDEITFRKRDVHNLAGCIGALALWCLLLTTLVVALFILS